MPGTFQAHAAPLALTLWRDHLVIAFHGSGNRLSKVGGPALAAVGRRASRPASVLAGGFLPEGADDALGRPAGLAVGADGAL